MMARVWYYRRLFLGLILTLGSVAPQLIWRESWWAALAWFPIFLLGVRCVHWQTDWESREFDRAYRASISPRAHFERNLAKWGERYDAEQR